MKDTRKNKPTLWERKDEIIKLYENISSIQIAKMFNCSDVAICQVLKKDNIKIKGTKFFLKGKRSSTKSGFKKGMIPWNKGLTKETDERVREYGKKGSTANLNEINIIELYTQDKLSAYEIAKKFKCSTSPIYRVLGENNIVISSRDRVISKARRLRMAEIMTKTWEERLGKERAEELKEQLRERMTGENNFLYKKTFEEVFGDKKAKEIRTKKSVTRKRLFKEGVLKPSSSCFKKGHKPIAGFKKGMIPWSTGLTKETDERVRKFAEKQKGRKFSDEWKQNIGLAKEIKLDMDLIKKEYIENERSCKELGKMFGTNHGTIWNRLKKEGVKIREKDVFTKRTRKKMSAGKQGIPLEEWKKFASEELYGIKFNNKFKRVIRRRDNQICMLCGIHKEKLNRTLDIHHIDYNKKLSIPQNCISLCRKCHNGTVHSTKHCKDHWINFFQSLLTKSYDYQYSENQEIVLNFNQENLKC